MLLTSYKQLLELDSEIDDKLRELQELYDQRKQIMDTDASTDELDSWTNLDELNLEQDGSFNQFQLA